MSHGNPRHLKRNRRKRPQPQPKPTVKLSATSGLLAELIQPMQTLAFQEALKEAGKV